MTVVEFKNLAKRRRDLGEIDNRPIELESADYDELEREMSAGQFQCRGFVELHVMTCNGLTLAVRAKPPKKAKWAARSLR